MSMNKQGCPICGFKGTPYAPINYDYDAAGNILVKGDYGSSYLYGNVGKGLGGNAGPNAIRQFIRGGTTYNFTYDNNGNRLIGDGATLTYDDQNKPLTVVRNGTTSTFSYDANGQRYKQVKQQGSSITTTYYVGSFEREVSSSATIDKTYIGDHTIKMKAHVGSLGNQSPFQHVLRDHLGSVDTLIDGQTGAVLQYRGYDVFGRPQDIAAGNVLLTAWQGVTKGYTNHEHLNEQQLIHMNGRIYDFNVGRFLSVDPFLQFPENSQSANPYSYILNNPMSGVDPTGYSAIRSGNASNWRVPMCDSNYGNTCAKTPVDNIMAQWGLSNGQSNESLAKQGQLKRQQIREERENIGLQEAAKVSSDSENHLGVTDSSELQNDNGANGNLDPKTLNKLSRKVQNQMIPAMSLAKAKMTSFCTASPTDCTGLSVNEFESTPFEWSKNKDYLHEADSIKKVKHIGAEVIRGPDKKVTSVQLFAGGIVLQGKTSAAGVAEVLLHEYWHTSAPGTASYQSGGDFETPAYKWSQAVMSHEIRE